jgi:hypothetical protein
MKTRGKGDYNHFFKNGVEKNTHNQKTRKKNVQQIYSIVRV